MDYQSVLLHFLVLQVFIYRFFERNFLIIRQFLVNSALKFTLRPPIIVEMRPCLRKITVSWLTFGVNNVMQINMTFRFIN